MEEDKKKLTSEQYWQYRTQLEEVDRLNLELKLLLMRIEYKKLEIKNKEQSIIIDKYSMKSDASAVTIKRQEIEQSEAEKKAYLESLENELGIDMKNVAISDLDFSITPLDEPNQEGD